MRWNAASILNDPYLTLTGRRDEVNEVVDLRLKRSVGLRGEVVRRATQALAQQSVEEVRPAMSALRALRGQLEVRRHVRARLELLEHVRYRRPAPEGVARAPERVVDLDRRDIRERQLGARCGQRRCRCKRAARGGQQYESLHGSCPLACHIASSEICSARMSPVPLNWYTIW